MNIFKLVAILILSVSLASCSETSDENTWLVGTSPDNPPYEHIKDGKIEGFDIDVMMAIGKHLGKHIQLKNMELPGLLAAIASKNIDMAIAGLSITDERQTKVDFSVPYAGSKIAVLFKKGENYKKFADLKGKIVGAQLGTTWSAIAEEESIAHSFTTKTLSNNLMLIEELKIGRIDAIVVEESQAEKFVETDPELSSFQSDQGGAFAIALPKGSPEKEIIDRAIKDLTSDGTIDALAKKWGVVGAN